MSIIRRLYLKGEWTKSHENQNAIMRTPGFGPFLEWYVISHCYWLQDDVILPARSADLDPFTDSIEVEYWGFDVTDNRSCPPITQPHPLHQMQQIREVEEPPLSRLTGFQSYGAEGANLAFSLTMIWPGLTRIQMHVQANGKLDWLVLILGMELAMSDR
jgi:hypothetical protein